MKLTSIILATFCLMPLPTKADSALKELLIIAEQNHPQIDYLRAAENLSLAKIQELQAQLQPQVRLQSELSYTIAEHKNYPRFANTLALNYPLSDPMLSAGEEVAISDMQSQSLLLEAGLQQIRLAAAQSYYQYWQEQAQLDYLQRERDFLIDLLFQVEERMQLGIEALEDMAQVESRLQQNRRTRLQSQSKLDTLRTALREQLGIIDRPQIALPSFNTKAIADEQPLVPEDLLEAYVNPLEQKSFSTREESIWQLLVMHNPKVEAIQQQVKTARKKIAQQTHFAAPRIEAFSALVYNDSNRNFYDDMTGIKAGIRLNAPLYLAGQDKALSAQARAQMHQLQALQRDQENQLIALAENSWQQIRNLYQQRAVQLKALSTAQCYLETIEHALVSGDSDTLELLEAQRKVYQEQSSLPQIEAQISQLKSKLFWALGMPLS
jgi:outer membrane protein